MTAAKDYAIVFRAAADGLMNKPPLQRSEYELVCALHYAFSGIADVFEAMAKAESAALKNNIPTIEGMDQLSDWNEAEDR